MAQPELDDDHVVTICRVLNEHGVVFVVIGGVAARLHETGYATVDIDVCPPTKDNLTRLAAALKCWGLVSGLRATPRASHSIHTRTCWP